MSLRHHKVVEWEARLKAVLDAIDIELEARYGRQYPLHPARPAHGVTGSRDSDGLFDIGAAFSAGFGSKQGAGYVLEIRMATLAEVPPKVRLELQRHVVERLRAELPRAFPGRSLEVRQDGNVLKIVGDLSLGKA